MTKYFQLAIFASLIAMCFSMKAQQAPAQAGSHPLSFVEDASHANWDYGALIQGGNGLTEGRDNFHFFMAGAHLGRDLPGKVGSGLLRGDFEYGVEFFPFWQSYTPRFLKENCYATPTPSAPLPTGADGSYCTGPYKTGGTFTGLSITPIILRWNFTHGQRWMPWIQGAGGLIWTTRKYPGFGGLPATLYADGPNDNTSVWNFTPQFGVGTHYFVRPRRSIDFSANAVHISSSSLGDKNPGVNASVQFSLGYSWWK